VDTEIINILSGFLINPVFIRLLLIVLMSLLYFNFRQLRKIFRDIRYVKLNQIAMDHALEQSLKNGYAKNKEEKLRELMARENYISGKE